MKTIEGLERIEKELEKSFFPQASREWSGADVVITSKTIPQVPEGGFYPEPRLVITSFSLELSWLFEMLRDAFFAEKRLDSCSKIEFFGRLANAANRYLQRSNPLKAHLLCAAVLHEAFVIFDEMEEGSFRCLAFAIGNEIVDDYVDDALRTGYIDTEVTLAFFKSRGVEVKHD